jgi:hypothetical protein
VAISVLLSAANGWAQYATFTPATEIGQEKLSARSIPAMVTTDDETTLASKGYVMIGTVEAQLAGKKINAEITGRLDAAARAKAAEAGGDLVHFELEGAPHLWDEPQFKTTCTKTDTWTSRGTTVSGTEYERKEERCIQSNVEEAGTKIKRDGFESQGTVWRYDPRLYAALGPKRAEMASAMRSTNPYTLIRMIGKNMNDPELHAWVTTLNATVHRFSTLTFYDCKSLGLKLVFGPPNESLFSINLYGGIDFPHDFKQYQGSLPYKLSFQLSRTGVESILGPPMKSKYNQTFADYQMHNPNCSVRVHYNNKRSNKIEPDAMLSEVDISACDF